jgi:hypothetical protein
MDQYVRWTRQSYSRSMCLVLFLSSVLLSLIHSTPVVRAQDIAPPSICTRQDAARLYSAGSAGGDGGNAFADYSGDGLRIELPRETRVLGVIVRAGDFVDGIQLVYNVDGRPRFAGYHGGGGGKRYEFWLEPGESITRISGKSGTYVDSIMFQTSTGRTARYGGGGGGNPFSYDIPTGYHLIGLWGRSGDYVDAIGLHYRRTC